MRPLFLEFPDDPVCRCIEDQFCSGEKLLVAPILTEMNCRKLYLPEGTWYNFWERKAVQGPKWIKEDCPLDKIPLYVRGGSFLPIGEIMQSVPDEIPERITLLAFPDGDKPLEYTLYDEKGHVRFFGEWEKNNLRIEIVYLPGDRHGMDIEVVMPPGYEAVQIEIVNRKQSR